MSTLRNLQLSSGVFFLVLALSLVSAQNDLELSPQNDLESMDDIQELIRNVQLIFETMLASKYGQGTMADDEEYAESNARVGDEDEENDVGVGEADDQNNESADPNGCSCASYGCCCCKRIRIRRFKFNKRCCLSLRYLRYHYGILVTLKLGGRTLFRREISAKNPPPICTRIPYLGSRISCCIQLNNLSVRRRRVSGCSTFLFRVFSRVLLRVRLGCFRFNFLNATQQIGEVEFPFHDGPLRVPAEGPEPIYIDDIYKDNIVFGGNKKK